MAYVHTTRLQEQTETAKRWLSYPLDSPPLQPPSQRGLALAKANEVRMLRAHLHHEIEALSSLEGRCRVAEILDDPADWLWKEEVGELLLRIRRFGRRRVELTCQRAGLSSSARIGGPYTSGTGPVATARQRALLIAQLLDGVSNA